MNRRTFVRSVLLAAVAGRHALAADPRPPHILLRSSWQDVNIGDVGHTPGILALLETHVPAAEVTLWASGSITPRVEAMLRKRFPTRLRDIVKGKIGPDGKADNAKLGTAVAWADFFLLGSGATLNARPDIEAFVKHTGKPFGVYGITHGGRYTTPRDKGVLDQARFAFFRDSVSLATAKKEVTNCPILEFGPDAAFGVDVRDDATATAYLAASGLEPGTFLALIPKYRYTPYWMIHGKAEPPTELDKERWAHSQKHAEPDHAKLREAATAFVRTTGMKLLVCPEDSSHMALGKTYVVDKLPADVRAKTVLRETFWPMEEAVAVYARAFALLSYDMHSPIMALPQGTPGIVCRTEYEQSSKGVMWRDIGLGDWLFDFDKEVDGANLSKALLAMAADPAAARAKAAAAMAVVRTRQRETMAVVAAQLHR